MKSRFFNIVPDGGRATILLYGDVGEYDKVDSGRVVSELIALSAQYNKIDVRINSCGGDVFSGIAIYNALKNSQANIAIYIDGVAASIAAIIALCGKPVYMSSYARLMLHNVSGGTCGSSKTLRETADMMDAIEKDLSRMVADRCKMKPEEVVSKFFDGTDHWMTAEECKKMKLCDGIYETDGITSSKPETTEDIYNYFNNRLNTFQPQNKKDMALLDDIRKIPSFEDKLDEKSVLEHIRTINNKATASEAASQANKTLQEKFEQLQNNEIQVILDKAVSDGKITQEQIASFTALMKSDRKNAENVLNAIKPKNNVRASQLINDVEHRQSTELTNKSWDEIDKLGKLPELKALNKELFAEKYQEKFGVQYKS